jgi:hypothetical protein
VPANINGVDYPQTFLRIKPADITRLGVAPILLAADLVRDFIRSKTDKNIVWGGDIVYVGGMTVQFFKPLVVYRGLDGKHFEDFDLAPTEKVINQADAVHPRIDRFYLTLQENADGEEELRHVKVLPSDPESPESDVSVRATKRDKLTISYRAGAASATPTPPDLNPGEIPFFQVYVPAGAVEVKEGSQTDERHRFLKLEELVDRFLALEALVNLLLKNEHDHPASAIRIGVGNRWNGKNAQTAFNEIDKILASIPQEPPGDPGDDVPAPALRLRPETIRNDVPQYHDQSGRLGAAGILDEGGAPCVEWPLPRNVDFASLLRSVEPEAFIDQMVNPRRFNKGANQNTETEKRTTPVTLGNIVVTESDGGGMYEKRNAVAPQPVTRNSTGGRVLCPRDERFIDIFGGGGLVGNQVTSAWIVYDTLADEFSTVNLTGDIPQYGIIFACSLGNKKVLLAAHAGAAGVDGLGALKWFLVDVDPASGTYRQSTYIPNGPGDGSTAGQGAPVVQAGVIGDLIVGGPNGVVSLLVYAFPTPGQNVAHFVYNVASNTFAQVAASGSSPNFFRNAPRLQNMDACHFRESEMIVVDAGDGPVKTFIYNHQSLSWRQINVAQPYNNIGQVNTILNGLSLANINGRIHLTSFNSSVWVLTSGTTHQWDALRVPALESEVGTRFYAGLTGMLVSGLPVGEGFIIGGRKWGGAQLPLPQSEVWRFKSTGVVAVDVDGEQGITIGSGSNTVTIKMPDGAALPWAVDSYILAVKGRYIDGQVFGIVSFDNGNTTKKVRPGENIIAPNSLNQPVRLLFLVLIGSADSKPKISSITETFVKAGSTAGEEWWARINPAIGTWYMYIDRDTGKVTLEAGAKPTTVNKCLLLRIERPGAAAPTVLNFINKVDIHRIVTVTQADNTEPNPLPCEPAFIRAVKYAADNIVKRIAPPAVDFNGDVTVAGLAVGETAEVELEA